MFEGITTEILASFNSDGSLDGGYLRDLVDFQLESGINAFFVCGLTPAETLCLNTEEKAQLASMVCRAVSGRVPVMSNVITNSYRDGIDLIRRFEDAGSDAVCITQPMVYKFPEEALYEYYARLISVSAKPVFLYNQPLSGNLLSPGLVSRLVHDFDRVAGYKDSTNDVTHLQAVILHTKDRKLDIVTGSDSTIFTSLTLGCIGGVSYLSGIFPRVMLDITDRYFAGDISGAMEAQQRALRVRELLKTADARSAYRMCSALTGHPMGSSKLPDAMLYVRDEKKAAYIRDELQAMGVL